MSTSLAVVLALLAGGAGLLYYRSTKAPCPTDADVLQITRDIDQGKTTPDQAIALSNGFRARGCIAAAETILQIAMIRKATPPGRVPLPTEYPFFPPEKKTSPPVLPSIPSFMFPRMMGIDRHPIVGCIRRNRVGRRA